MTSDLRQASTRYEEREDQGTRIKNRKNKAWVSLAVAIEKSYVPHAVTGSALRSSWLIGLRTGERI